MEIEKITITVGELCKGYVYENELDLDDDLYVYGGKLRVRPKCQQSIEYKPAQENAVIDAVLNGDPLKVMRWVDNGDGTYDCVDGKKQILSICHFEDGVRSWCVNGEHIYIYSLKRTNPTLLVRFMNYPLEIYICRSDTC